MLLKELIQSYPVIDVTGNPETEITSIEFDSRRVEKGTLFVCIEGFKTDGHRYIESALSQGASAILVQQAIRPLEGIAVIRVADTREALAFVADRFFDQPSKKMNLIGVTGTKGKTTTTYMIKAILEAGKSKVGLIGTVVNSIGDEVIPAERTTPEATDLQGLFHEMLQKGASECVMEVSSHALDLKRVAYTDFRVGIFTNLSRDHLDFHETFDNYFNAKCKLFDLCRDGVVNIDTSYGKELQKRVSQKLLTVGIESPADVKAENITYHKESVEFDVVSEAINGRVSIPIPGTFTVYNALCAIGAARLLGIPIEQVQEGLRGVKVPGRAEVVDLGKDYTIMVDYAHTPDSLQNILESVKQFARGRVVSVFGCGGDRDRTKRPIMGEISGELADFTIITSDNPRTESPAAIIMEIEEGMKKTGASYIKIEDRRAAIRYAMEHAQKDDVIVVAGKGHETYQLFADRKIDFDERVVIKEIYEELERQCP